MSQRANSPYVPPLLHPGNRTVPFGGDADFEAIGVHELRAELIKLRPLDDGSPREGVEVAWEEAPAARAAKRRRKARLRLCCCNHTALPAAISASLPAEVQPATLGGTTLTAGLLQRQSPERDATPSLPASLGRDVRFVTLASAVPPRHEATLCECAADADERDGFVYLAGVEEPHPAPEAWCGHVLRFPLGGPGAWMCTQGFGGAGHHKGRAMHHACDFECDEGTPVCAVATGTITRVVDSKRLGAGHVDLLPEANELQLRLEDGSVAVYLHLAQGSARVAAGEHVAAGQVLASSGNVGFTTGPHLHFQLNRDGAADEEAQTQMFAFADGAHSGGVVPVAGHHFGERGLLGADDRELLAAPTRGLFFGGGAPANPSSGPSDRAEPPRTCRVCQQGFRPRDNHAAACHFHPGPWLGVENAKLHGTRSGGEHTGVSHFWDCCGAEEQSCSGCCRARHQTYDGN
jgi:murein DD-endopeptidase MepM/ murein hydrolase activator NlpD